MDKELKKILLKRKSKVIVNVDITINQLLLHSIEDTVSTSYEEKYPIPEVSSIEVELIENNIIEFEISLDNMKKYNIQYRYGELINTFYSMNKENEKEISQEKIDVLSKSLDDLYQLEYNRINKKYIHGITLNRNLESLGYCMDEDMYSKVATMDEKEITELNEELIENLKEMVGANVEYHPMYPNFPKQVMDMKYHELYINAIFHYWSSGKYIPVYDKEERDKKPIEVKLKYLSCGTESEIHELMKNLMNSAEAISPNDIADIATYFKKYPEFLNTIPESFVNKENLAIVTNLIMKNCKEPPVIDIAKRFSTTTDVLRLAAVMSNQSAALEGKKIKFKSFSNKERRLIMDLLNKCNNRFEDFFRHRNKWERVCERIHPEKYRKTHGTLVDDLLGVYKYKRVIKQIAKEIELYKTIFTYMNKYNDVTNELSQSALDEIKDILKKASSLKLPKEIDSNIKNSINTYIISHQNQASHEKLVIAKDVIEKRIEVAKKITEEHSNSIIKFKTENIRYDAKVAKAIKEKKYVEAMELLSQRPGIFLRHLDEFVIKHDNTDEVLKSFEEVASKASVKVLLSVKGYFAKRNKDINNRIFLIKGKVSKVYMTKTGKKALSQDLCDKICRICENALIEKFEGKPKLNNVYIEEQIMKQILPQDLRSANAALDNYSKGSRFSLSYKQLSPEKVQIMVDEIKSKINDIEVKKGKIIEEKEALEKLIPKEEIENKKEGEDEENEEVRKKRIKFEREMEMKKEKEKEKLEKLTKQINRMEIDIKNHNEEINDLLKAPICSKYNKIRCFIWWTNTKNLCVDIDLSVSILNENFERIASVSFSNLKNEKFQIYHSGDIVDGGPVNGRGAAEFIDLDPKVILENDGRYIVFNVNSYVGIPFGQMENCKFGWMERESINSNTNEIFEPKTVRQRLDLSSENTSTTPVIFDCKTNEFIWIDTNVSQCESCVTIEKGGKAINAILRYYCDPLKENLYNLIQMHIKARNGTQVDSEEELKSGDTAFVMENPYKKIEGVKYIRPTDLDVILSEYMTASDN